MAFKNKVTIEEITRYTKEQAERNALTMNNPLVVPVYVAIDTNEEGVSRIASQNLNSLFGKQVEMPNRKYTETEYLVFKSFQLGMSDGQVPDVLAKYESFKELVHEICEDLKINVVALECDKDHTHMFLNALPILSPADIMAKIKGVTSRKLREEFSHLQHLPSLWTRSYFVSTAGNVSSETIKRYVEQQKTKSNCFQQKNRLLFYAR